MSFDPRDYPENWKEMRTAILKRAGHRCEGSPAYPDCRAKNYAPHPVTGSRVVLTIAHYPDATKSNVDPANLHAWCQRCHLFADLPRHIEKRRETLRLRRERVQPALCLEERD